MSTKYTNREWITGNGPSGFYKVVQKIADGSHLVLATLNRYYPPEANARLIAAAPDLLDLVLNAPADAHGDCLWCGEDMNRKHKPDCPRQAALRKAGVLKETKR